MYNFFSQLNSQRWWLGLAIFTVITVSIAGLIWIFAHPYGVGWDESYYINRAYFDVGSFQEDKLLDFIKVLARQDSTRPPAYRLLALPFTLTVGISPAILRILSLSFFWISLVFVFLAANQSAGVTCGAFAVIFLVISPIIIGPILHFGTEYPLYCAIAALLYFLLASLSVHKPKVYHWIGLGIALGLGGLAKTTFVLVAAPMMFMAFILNGFPGTLKPNLMFLLKGSGFGFIILSPWWFLNFKDALAKSMRSSQFVRHSLGERGHPETLFKWLSMFAQAMLGLGLTLLVIVVILTLVLRIIRHSNQWSKLEKTALALCLSGAIPALTIGAFAVNQNPRLFSPALFPLAIAIAIIAVKTCWTTSSWLTIIATILLASQLAVLVGPSFAYTSYDPAKDLKQQGLLGDSPRTVLEKEEQWDWSKLLKIANENGIKNPDIAYLGNSNTLNLPSIMYPWARSNQLIWVTRLWRYEEGKIQWEDVIKKAEENDIAITFSGFVRHPVSQENIDNQHNLEFVERLIETSHFSNPIELTMGRFDQSRVFVLFRKKKLIE